MTDDVLTAGPGAPRPTAGPAAPAPGAGTWRLTWSGLRTVAVLELRQRVRSTRWIIVLLLWGGLLGVLTALIHYATHQAFAGITDTNTDEQTRQAGATTFGLVVFLVLALGALVAPALSATSINGDRSAGVLATLQTTLLSPAEIALGKLTAAWITALALLAVALPFIGWAYLDGGTPAGRLAVVLALLAVMLLVVCAIGLGWSAVTARTTSSAVLTYLSVTFLGLGLPVLFGLLIPLSQQSERVTTRQMVEIPSATTAPAATDSSTPPPMQCQTQTETIVTTHTERIWWVLAPNPAVVIADAAPMPAGSDHSDVLSSLRSGVRELRLGEPSIRDWCYTDDAESRRREAARQAERERLGATWPYGLAGDLALGACFFVLTVRRLRAPARKLARGTRVA
jgi:ABC-type transport system involved in multi-copper enzyme maturation permease subunit